MQFFLLETTLRKHIATVKPNWAMSKNGVLRKWQKTKVFELKALLPFHLI